jgi:hypothetical protein
MLPCRTTDGRTCHQSCHHCHSSSPLRWTHPTALHAAQSCASLQTLGLALQCPPTKRPGRDCNAYRSRRTATTQLQTVSMKVRSWYKLAEKRLKPSNTSSDMPSLACNESLSYVWRRKTQFGVSKIRAQIDCRTKEGEAARRPANVTTSIIYFSKRTVRKSSTARGSMETGCDWLAGSDVVADVAEDDDA